jgi:archaellum biogenesis ATPase FlaH
MENTLVQGLKERIANAAFVNQSLGIILPGNNYHDLTHAIYEYINETPNNNWVYVTTSKPFNAIKKEMSNVMDSSSVFFIDCVSRAAGIQTKDPQCYFLDSPSQLEQLILEIVNIVKNKPKDNESFVILDTISSLLLYNDELLVAEFFTHLINNMNLYNTHTISLCLEEEMTDQMNKMLYLKNNKIIKVKESFI